MLGDGSKNTMEYDPRTLYKVTRGIENRGDPRYLRVLWINDDVDWNSMPIELAIMRSLEIDGVTMHPVLMLDASTYCWS